MSKIKKLICLIVCFLITAAFLTACGAADEEIPEYITGIEGDANLDGYKYIFYVISDMDEAFFLPEYSSSSYGDKILSRYKEVEQRFNASVTVSLPVGNITTSIISGAASGIKYADLIELGAGTVYSLRSYLMALNELENFDIYSGKWGPESYLKTTKFGDDNYGFMAGYWGMPYPQYIGNLYFIGEFLKTYSLENPQEYYENGTWTWEVFRDMCERATITDPADSAKNVYGFVISDEMKFPKAWIISNGGKPIKYDEENDYYYYGLNEPEAVEALQYLKDMVDEGIGYYSPSAWEEAAIMFKEFRTLFYEAFNKVSFYNYANHLASPEDFPYGHSWVPYPCGPKGTYGASTAQFWYTARFLAMPENFDEYSRSAATILTNAIFEPLDGETEDSWKDAIEKNFFFDSLSFKYYIELFENGEPDYSTQAYNVVFNNMASSYRAIITGTSTVAEAVAKNMALSQATIDETLNSD